MIQRAQRRIGWKAALARLEAGVDPNNVGVQGGLLLATVFPESTTGTAPRDKRRRRLHKPVKDAKQRREAAAAAIDDMDTEGDHSAPFPPRWRNRIILWT